jgi:hypothetical protein
MIVAKSSGAARLDLEQAERRYFAIPILTFYEFIKSLRASIPRQRVQEVKSSPAAENHADRFKMRP